MTEIESRLAAIETRIALSELRAGYCWHTARGDRDAVVALFTDDGVFENFRGAGEDPVTITGRAALHAHLAPMRPGRRIPMVTNEVTRIIGPETAEGTCVMQALGEDPFCGHYIDDFRRVGGAWLFSRRRFFPYWPIFRPDAERVDP